MDERSRPNRLAVAVAVGAGLLALGALAGALGATAVHDDGTSPTAPTTPALDVDAELAVARALRPVVVPSDCPVALDDHDLLPNAARTYRGGVHEGIDLICGGLGHDAVAAFGGRVLVAEGAATEPTPEERVAILEEAEALGDTPPWTLVLLYGRFVVIDSGVVPGAGHLVTIYGHLDEVDPSLRPGLEVVAGTRIGAVGNRGTGDAGTGRNGPESYQLHWEIQVDDRFLGEGADPDDTEAIYRALLEG